MKLECLGSSSSGNCYIFHPQIGKKLILECGVKYSEILMAIEFNPSEVCGCIISHEHRDHCKALPDILKAGIRCYALSEVFESFNLRTSFMCEQIKPLLKFRINDFLIIPLAIKHDVPCLGFVISHPEMGNTLFLTDTMYTEYRIKGLHHVMIEANYCDDILNRRIEQRLEKPFMRDRLLKSHMELATTIKILKETDLQSVNEIILLHLSARNSDFQQFKNQVIQNINRPVYIARNDMIINFNKNPY